MWLAEPYPSLPFAGARSSEKRKKLVLARDAAEIHSIASGRRKSVMVTASRQQQKSQSPWGVRAAAAVAGLALLITL